MIPLIKNNIEAIRELCKKHHVKSLSVFGSAVNEITFREQSDIDLLYEIDTDNYKNWATDEYDYVDNLSDLEINLKNLLTRKIDLIPYRNIHNRYFKQSVDSTCQLIYGS